MTITRFPPNTIHLGGEKTEVGDVAAGEAITPGMLVEQYNDAGTMKYRKHSTAAGVSHAFALNASMLNKGVDDAYAIGDLMEVGVGHIGSTWWAIIPSGQTIVAGDKLESAGTGKLRAWTNSPAPFKALEAKTAVADTRIRVEIE